MRPSSLLLLLLVLWPFMVSGQQPSDQRSSVLIDALLERSFRLRSDSNSTSIGLARRAAHLAMIAGDRGLEALAYQRLSLGMKYADEMDSAVFFARKGWMIAEEAQDQAVSLKCSMVLCDYLTRRRDFTEALVFGTLSIELAEKLKDEGELAKACNNMAAVYGKLDDRDKAVEYAYRGLEIKKRIDPASESASRITVGNLFFELGRMDLAEVEYKKCIALARAYGNKNDLAAGHLNLGNVYYEVDRNGDARTYLDSAVEEYRTRVKNPGKLLLALHSLTMVELREGKLAHAADVLQQADPLLGDQDDNGLRVQNDFLYSKLFLAKGQLRESMDRARSGLALAIAIKDRPAQAKLHYQIARILKDKGDYQGAIDEMLVQTQLRDSIAMENSVEKFATASMREKYEAEQTGFELMKLRNEKEVVLANAAKARIRQIALVVIVLLLVAVLGVLIRNLQHRKRLARQDHDLYEKRIEDLLKQQEIRQLDALVEGQEKERKRIAKDLHDRLGSMLSAIKLQFSALEERLDKVQVEQSERYRHVFVMLDDAVTEVRRISHDMVRTSLAQFGLAGALKDLRDAVHVPGKLEMELDLFGLDERLEQNLEIALYRMVQEAVSNILKHAEARHVSVQVTRSGKSVNVMVEDDGRGFDPSKAAEGMGTGNIRERAREFNGSVAIDARPGRGTIVSIDIPLA
ncbi:MAG: tetratricopeptide repeat protein [Flavobacteriales bacterium]|nr:tetratricopeptide repeat protein [Flavobacteriales bacterium]